MTNLLILLPLIAITQIARAGCLTLVKGPVAIDVEFCGNVTPEKLDTTKEKNSFIKELDVAGRKDLLDSYRGVLVRGKVVQSQAVREGISKEIGVLRDKKVGVFIPPGKAVCKDLNQKRITGFLAESCCDGNGNAPCLLGTSYAFRDVSVLGPAGATPEKKSEVKNETLMKAEALYSQKKYTAAIEAFKKAEASGAELKPINLFRLGHAYRENEDCEKAIAPLKKVYDLHKAGKLWAEDDINYRRSIFLLARCHSRMHDANVAVFYLNGYLQDSQKYRKEIQQSLKHKDFGWIHTTKEYRDYKEAAQKALRTKDASR